MASDSSILRTCRLYGRTFQSHALGHSAPNARVISFHLITTTHSRKLGPRKLDALKPIPFLPPVICLCLRHVLLVILLFASRFVHS